MSEKYIVFSIKDIRSFGDQAMMEYMVNIQTFLNRRRRETKEQEHARKVAREAADARTYNRSPEVIPQPNFHDPVYFVLKLSDPIAVHALDQYILRGSEAPEYNNSAFGLRAAVDHAIQTRTRAVMFCEQHIPDPE